MIINLMTRKLFIISDKMGAWAISVKECVGMLSKGGHGTEHSVLWTASLGFKAFPLETA